MTKIKIYKSIILPIKTSKKNIDYLYQCNKETARVWNKCLTLNKQLWKTEEKRVDRKYLQDNTKGVFSDILPAKCIQITIKKYLGALTGIRKARKQGRADIKYPWKQKKNYNTIWDRQMIKIDYDKNIIRMPRPQKIINHKRILNPLFLKFKYPLPQNIVQIELIYNNGLKLAVNYYEEAEYMQINSNNVCGVDLGEIHSITSVDNNGNSLIITGRQIRSIQRFRNKELGKLQNKLSKCTKNSNNYKKYRKAIRKLMSKSNSKLNYCLHATSKMFLKYCLENSIKTIIIGDLKQFNMNLKNRNNYSSQQKLVQWTHGQLIQKIKEKVEKYGVEVVEISEAYTSQTCPNCNHKHKPTGRNYVCTKCGFTMHRDLVGAVNILSKYLNDGKIKKLDIDVKPIKYLRIA